MPREFDGKRFLTQEDASRQLGVTSRTLRSWFRNGVVTPPPKIGHGIRRFRAFTEKWVDAAKREIDAYRNKRERD